MCADCRVYIQWAFRNPRDWQPIRASQWHSIPNRGIPNSPGGRDNSPGWIHSICVQGVEFANHDHYTIEIEPDALIVTQWTDDLDDFSPDEFVAHRWTLKHLTLDFEIAERFNLEVVPYNTVQSIETFAGAAVIDKFLPEGKPSQLTTAVRPWSEFAIPATSITRHGVWLPGSVDNPQSLYRQHQAIRKGLHWDSWTEGVPIGRVRNGRVVNE